jgi:hypothetical protein
MPIRQTDKGWYWGSKGPFKTKKKALAVQGGAYASGYKESREHLTKEVLVEFVDEVMGDLDPMQGGWGGVTGRGQKKHKPTPSVERAEDAFIGSVLGHRYASLDYKEQVALEQKLKKVINDAIDAELENFTPTSLDEEKWGKAQGRDYSKEKKTAGDPKNIERKRARRAAEKAGRVSKGDGKDVHHPKGYSGDSPTQVMSQSQNRGMAGEGGRKKGSSN